MTTILVGLNSSNRNFTQFNKFSFHCKRLQGKLLLALGLLGRQRLEYIDASSHKDFIKLLPSLFVIEKEFCDN